MSKIPYYTRQPLVCGGVKVTFDCAGLTAEHRGGFPTTPPIDPPVDPVKAGAAWWHKTVYDTADAPTLFFADCGEPAFDGDAPGWGDPIGANDGFGDHTPAY